MNKVLIGDCAEILKTLEDESIDCIVTDPPYGYSFMGLNWDKALPSHEALKECCRVLKSGAFAFFMCAPRQDVLSRMIIKLEDAGFNIGFSSVYWAYASGFPKAANIQKLMEKKEIEHVDIFNGGFAGNQLKPALECIIVVMKPLSEKTYVAQALKNGHGCTWLNDCRIPYEKDHEASGLSKIKYFGNEDTVIKKSAVADGRFPANLLVSDNVLDQGINKKGIGKSYSGYENKLDNAAFNFGNEGKERQRVISDSGDFSRYFSLDAWWEKRISELPEEQQKTFPFLIVPKPAKSEKNKYCENKHPTVKPLKLMSYLITMGSREGDTILDPYAGSGTVGEACTMLGRNSILIEMNPEYEPLITARANLNVCST